MQFLKILIEKPAFRRAIKRTYSVVNKYNESFFFSVKKTLFFVDQGTLVFATRL